MTDSSDPSLAPRTSRTSPEAIASRTFTQAKRGYAESEVRAYLRLVADDAAAATARERELEGRLRELEDRLRQPMLPQSDQDLIALLGEETARVLGQARESAAELRGKAEEHARRVVREAQETARELRTTTQQAVETKTREAEDSARARAKEIVGEARAMRERVLNDLNERRQQLERQIADLRAGRGHLVETYQLVERALSHATRVMADEPSAAPEVPPLVADAPDEAAPADTTVADTTGDAGSPDLPDHAGAVAATAPESAPTADEAAVVTSAGALVEDEPTSSPDVGALFEKLRSEHTEGEGGGDPAATPEASATPEAQREPETAEASESHAEAGDTDEDGEPPSAHQAAIGARDAALADVTDDLVRRGKRALQDEQNDILDGLRRQRGKIDTGKVLPPLDEQLARWAHVLQPAVDSAYASGATAVGGALGSAPRALLTELSTSTVTPLRDRLGSSMESIDSRSPADTEIAIAQRLGARYREWRGQELEAVLGDAVAVAYSRGVYDAAPEGTRLRWVPAHEGKCPDCDDNSLEPTVKGGDFPTGQPFPPAHPGCRCMLELDGPE
jgi:DivIVA domain-containing protein